jgi:TrmH family RNA methyltransferase
VAICPPLRILVPANPASSSNAVKLLTVARDLQRRKARERQQRFVAEGVRTVETLLASPLHVVGLLVTEALRQTERGQSLIATVDARGLPVQEVSEEELASAADTETPQGVLAVAEIPIRGLDPAPVGARYLVLDALQDPGNVGTVIRTAAAMGVTATVALPGTVDVWNAKVVRSSMGALFLHPVVTMSWEDLAAFIGTAGAPVALWAADMEGLPVDQLDRHPLPPRLALVVSNEGAGLSPHVAAAVHSTVSIPMAEGVESLNVAVAAGILLYSLRGGTIVASPVSRSS